MSRTRRQADHDAGVRYVARALRRRGCHVETIILPRGISLLVTPPRGVPLEVAVRVARTRGHTHPVNVAGKRYVYRYQQLHWNLHSHGKRTTAPDVWVLVALGGQPRAFVVPPALVPGKSAMLLEGEAKRPRRSRLRRCLGRWDYIVAAAAGKAA